MDSKLALEVVGYVASILVAVSLMMSSILRLRLVNLLGSAAFTVYGALIGAYPVAVVNLLIVFINLYYLRQMLGSREYFRLLRVPPDSEYLRAFLDFHRDEVARFLPGWRHAPAEGQVTFFVLRDMVPAGLFVGEPREGGRLRVLLDFVIPRYRDFKTGRYLFADQAEFFRELGVREIESEPGSPKHADYLRRMGFAPDATGLYHLPVG
ncbi:MAG TPA: hypothetical protein VHG51_13270 [Longimicrobiaceae bacterium]|nr:hypothetical protein [Longimicrobiaceae bacterium]